MLDSNLVGELQWKLSVDEFGFGPRSIAAAAGWDGDRYAVLENDDRQVLLLLTTTWDSPAEAQEFGEAYRELLGKKHPDGIKAWQVDVRGNDVLIVEGGERERQPDYLDVLARATRRE